MPEHPDADARRAAIVGLYWHAYGVEDEGETLRPLPLLEVAAILRRDETPAGITRRRRAIATLGSGGAGRDWSGVEREALEHLEAPLKEIEALLRKEPGLPRPAIASRIFSLLGSSAQPGCETGLPDTTLVRLPDGSLQATTRIRVKRDDFEKLRQAADPQSWCRCSDFFEHSYVAKEVGGAYPPNQQHDVEPHDNPPTPGDTWKAVLFEDFVFDFRQAKGSRFKNLFDIDAVRVSGKAGAAEHRVHYRLRRSLWSRVLTDEIQGGIAIDDGYTTLVEKGDGWVDVEARKTLRFEGRPSCVTKPLTCDRWLNLWASSLLRALGSAVADGLCCDPSAGRSTA